MKQEIENKIADLWIEFYVAYDEQGYGFDSPVITRILERISCMELLLHQYL